MAPAMIPEKPLFMHLIGVEGCGHHGVFPIFETLLRQKFEGSGRALFFRRGLRPFIHGLYYRKIPKHFCVAEMVTFLEANPGAIIVEDNSYPSGKFREVNNQWDFAELHQLLIPHCAVRYIHLRRNIFNTVNSHPDWDGGLLGHAAKLAEIGRYMDGKLAALKADGVEIAELDYDRMEEQAAEIAALTGCGVEDAEQAIATVFRKSDKDYRRLLASPDIAAIGELFGAEG
jgi:hypothetical protein